MLEKTLESPLDCTEVKPVSLKGSQPSVLSGRTDADAKASVLWPPDVKSWLTGKKSPDAGKDWGRRRKRQKKMRWVDGITHAVDMHLGKLWEMVRDSEACHPAVPGLLEESDTVTEQQQNKRHIQIPICKKVKYRKRLYVPRCYFNYLI